MIIRQTTSRQSRCVVCSLLPIQSSRNATTRAELAIPRHNLLEEHITGPPREDLQIRPPPVQPFSSPRTPGILRKHRLLQYWRQKSGSYGSQMDIENLAGKPSIKFHTADDITLEALMAAQAHMGHSTSLWNPMNSRYIFGVRHGIHIISLEATASHLKRAARVVESVASKGGVILFVGTRNGQRTSVVTASQMTGGCYLFSRWIPGTISNGQQLLERCDVSPVTPDDREIAGFQEEIREKLPVLKPDLVVCMNPMENKTLLRECAAYIIPTIGVIDTDADPTTVTYPIPANDDSLRCIRLISGVLGKAGEKGRLARLESAARGEELPYPPFNLMDIAFEGKKGFDGDGAVDGDQKGRDKNGKGGDNKVEVDGEATAIV